MLWQMAKRIAGQDFANLEIGYHNDVVGDYAKLGRMKIIL
jgi:hypothetical protein